MTIMRAIVFELVSKFGKSRPASRWFDHKLNHLLTFNEFLTISFMICLAFKLCAREGIARLFPGAMKGDVGDGKGFIWGLEAN